MSKLQTEIAVSTTEDKYQAQSMYMQDLLPLWMLIEEIAENSFINQMHLPGTQLFSKNCTSKVFDDNQSCLTITTTDTNCPCTKHLAIKFHHFHDQVLNGSSSKSPHQQQLGQYLTKPLTCTKFKCLCLLIMGW